MQKIADDLLKESKQQEKVAGSEESNKHEKGAETESSTGPRYETINTSYFATLWYLTISQ